METPKKFTFPEPMWAGTEQSLAIAMEAHNAMMAGMYDQPAAQPASEPDVPYNFSMQGNIGVVSIKGPLVNNDSEYNRYRGVTSYADIRRAVIHAATTDGVQAILLDIDSGGGAVSGVADVGNLISTIDKGIKPVYAFTDGMMASAAYWVGVSAREVYVSQTSMSGSIGVISTHMEQSKMLKDAGIGVTVMRAGEFKALASSVEPLSETAQKQIQLQLNAAYQVFAEHVSSNLGVSMPVFEKTMGQGREFFGAAAVDAGLAKGVMTYDSMVSMINKKLIDKSVKKGNTLSNYPQGVQMTRKALTEQQIAAIASGAGLQADAEVAAEAEALVAQAAVAEASALESAAVLTESQKGNDGSALVSYLQAQIKEKDAELLAQGVELSGIKSRVAGIEASHLGLVKIAAGSISSMRLALRLPKADFSAMAPEMLLAEHAATSPVFAANFKVGGVAGVALHEEKAEVQVDPHHLARIAATSFSHK